jgi:hypothetical protein
MVAQSDRRHMRQLNRADFLRVTAVFVGGALLGCGGGDGGDGGDSSGGSPGAGGGPGVGGDGSGGDGLGAAGGQSPGCGLAIDAQITCREGHSLLISVDDLMAAQTKTYDIRGTNATHGHNVTITAEMFAALQLGETVQIDVPSAVLPHTVFIKCEGLDPSALDDVDC